MNLNREQVTRIKKYFEAGYTYALIFYIMVTRHAMTAYRFSYFRKVVLSNLGLTRRGRRSCSPFGRILGAVLKELDGPGSCSGMNDMWLTLKLKYHLKVRRSTVRRLVKILDPVNVERRKRRRLMRRQYRSKGPNFVWHMDGYDKLTPFGINIHGAIDGYSRKIMWLKAGITNRKPQVIAGYFYSTVYELKGCPTIVRADRGTENGKVAQIQRALRALHMDTLSTNSFWYGTSPANQRIEAWWSILRMQRSDFFIRHFKDMESRGEFQFGNNLHKKCVQYSYLDLIQDELNGVVERWNHHIIREQRTRDVVSGRPDVLFNNPELTDTHDYIRPVDINGNTFLASRQECIFMAGNEEFQDVADNVCNFLGFENNPTTVEAAHELYLQLVAALEYLLE